MYRADLRRRDRKKITEVWAWHTNDNSGPEKCAACKQFQAQANNFFDCTDYKGSGVACDSMAPECGYEEEEFLQVWSYMANQFRSGFNGPESLDYSACIKIAEALGYEVDEIFMRRLRAVERVSLR